MRGNPSPPLAVTPAPSQSSDESSMSRGAGGRGGGGRGRDHLHRHLVTAAACGPLNRFAATRVRRARGGHGTIGEQESEPLFKISNDDNQRRLIIFSLKIGCSGMKVTPSQYSSNKHGNTQGGRSVPLPLFRHVFVPVPLSWDGESVVGLISYARRLLCNNNNARSRNLSMTVIYTMVFSSGAEISLIGESIEHVGVARLRHNRLLYGEAFQRL